MTALSKLVWVETKLFLREATTVIFTFALPLMILYILGGVFGNTPDPEVFRGRGPIDYFVPAYIGLAVAAIGLISLPVHVADYRERGVLRRLRASTAPIWAVLSSQVIVAIGVATIGSGLLVTAAFLFTEAGPPVSALQTVGAYLVVAVGFAAVGLALGSLLPTARAAQAVGLLFWFAEMNLAGAGPPPEVMPESLVTVGKFTPLWHAVRLLQDTWWGAGWNWAAFGVFGAFVVVAVLVTARLFRWE